MSMRQLISPRLLWRASGSSTPNWKIFRAAALVGVLSLFPKLAAMLKELIVAQIVGRGDVLDAFVIAFAAPTFVVNVIAGSFNSALIPIFISIRHSEGAAAAQRLFSNVLVWTTALLIFVTLALAITAPYYLSILAPNFSPQKMALTRRLSYLLLPYVMFSGLVINWTAVVNAGHRFALPALSPIVTPVLTSVFLFATWRVWGGYSLPLGVVIGTGIEGLILAWALKRQGWSLAFRWTGMDQHSQSILRQYAPLAMGTVILGASALVDQGFAARLAPGSVAALSYGYKIISPVIAIASLSLSTAALPYFSELVSERNWDACRHTIRTYVNLSFVFGLPLVAVLALFSRTLVKLLFQRGAFGPEDTRVVSLVQAMYAIQIPFYLASIVLVRFLSSIKRNDLLLISSGISLVIDVVLNIILSKAIGVAGVALSTSLFYAAAFMFLSFCVLRLLKTEASRCPALPLRIGPLKVN